MAVKTSCTPVRPDVVIQLEQIGDTVHVLAANAASLASRWLLGYLKQDVDGQLYFERCGSISNRPGYPAVATEPGGKIKAV